VRAQKRDVDVTLEATGTVSALNSVDIRPQVSSVITQVHIREGTPEWRAWQRHLVATTGRGTPVNNRGGWYFPSKLPLLEAETPPKAHAHSSLEPLGFLRAVTANGPQHFT